MKLSRKLFIASCLTGSLSCWNSATYAAGAAVTNDIHFANPAMLALVKNQKFIVGNAFPNVKMKFQGTSLQPNFTMLSGQARSNETVSLPYAIYARRINQNIVVSLNAVSSVFGVIDYGPNSLIRAVATRTDLRAYKFGPKVSLKITDKLYFGAGLDIERLELAELGFVTPFPENSHLITRPRDWSTGFDLGLMFMPNQTTILGFTYYPKIVHNARGNSIVGVLASDNYRFNFITVTAIAASITKFVKQNWLMALRVYWQNFAEQNPTAIALRNTGSTQRFPANQPVGTFVFPTNWTGAWTFDYFTRYAYSEKIAFLGGVQYVTNYVPMNTNAPAYPYSSIIGFSLGIDVPLNKDVSTQLIYAHGDFVPRAKIEIPGFINGRISTHFNAFVAQFTWQV